jgi:hypothetical protein
MFGVGFAPTAAGIIAEHINSVHFEVCRFSLLMAVALLMIKDFHAWEPLGFCFIADTLAVIE